MGDKVRLISESSNAAIGAIGSACILGAYVLITFSSHVHRLTGWRPSPQSYTYQVLNLLGGGFAGASAYLTQDQGALPLAVLETIWAIIAVAGLVHVTAERCAAQTGGQAGQGAVAGPPCDAAGKAAVGAPEGEGV